MSTRKAPSGKAPARAGKKAPARKPAPGRCGTVRIPSLPKHGDSPLFRVALEAACQAPLRALSTAAQEEPSRGPRES